MSWFGDIGKFELFHGKDLLKSVWKDPSRLITGVDPFSTHLWNGVLGTDKKPLVDQMGGATGDDYRKAEAAGIDTSAGKGMQNIAHVIAAIEAGGYGANALGGAGAAGAGAGEAGGLGSTGGLSGGLEYGGAGGGLGMGGTGGLGSGAASSGGGFSLGELGGGSGGGAYDMGSMFGGSGGGSAAGGTDWGKLMQSGMKGFNSNAQGSNQAQLAAQQALADQLRKSYEAQLQQSQQLPGWVNTSGA